jgi:predicted Zn-dependent protease
MIKILFQFIILTGSFLAIWFGLSRVDWRTLFKIEEKGENTEEQLGNLYWDVIKKLEKELQSPTAYSEVDSMLIRICEANDIDRKKIKLHLIDKDDINAFALPGHHMVVYSGLIKDCESAEELCGVLAHEMAHMEKDHIMRKLIREIGLGVLISMTTGGGNPEIIQQAIKILTSSAYSRELEREADITGADYLMKANIDPEPFAAFLYRLSAREKDMPDQLFWITSHPGSEERAKTILDYIKTNDVTPTPVMDSIEWSALREAVQPVF